MTVTQPEQQSELEPARAPADQQWVDYLQAVLGRDKRVQSLIGSEHLDTEDVMTEALKLAASPHIPDLKVQFHELQAQRAERDAALARKRRGVPGARERLIEWLISAPLWLSMSLVLLIILACISAIFVSSFYLLSTSPARYLVLLGGVSLLLSLARTFLTPPSLTEKSSAALAVERLDAELGEQVTSLLLVPAIELLASITFRRPSEDPVRLADARYLGARILPSSRVQTSSYRRVLTSLRRAGGATIGLAGSRGVGKSELLRAFCDNPYEQASLDNAGTIGVVVAAPVAYVPADFLRLLIKRIAEQVPSYHSDPERRGWQPTSMDLITLGALVTCLAAGLTLLGTVAKHRHGAGWLLVALALLITLGWLKLRFIDEYRIRRESKPSLRRPADLDAAGARITRQARLRLAQRAAEVAQRMQYLVTRTSALETSVGVGKSSLKSTGGLSPGPADAIRCRPGFGVPGIR